MNVQYFLIQTFTSGYQSTPNQAMHLIMAKDTRPHELSPSLCFDHIGAPCDKNIHLVCALFCHLTPEQQLGVHKAEPKTWCPTWSSNSPLREGYSEWMSVETRTKLHLTKNGSSP